MAGFLGWLRLDDGQARVAEALESLRHHPSFCGELIVGDERCGAAVLYRPNDPPEVASLPERGLLVAVLGAVVEFQAGRWHRYTARELGERYLDQGIGAVSGLDGFYQLLIWDGEGSKLHILDDRVGSMWVQYAHTESSVAFAPEAKALFRLLPLAPRLDFNGVVSFLNVGYPIGTSTLFEGVQLLAPAHRFSIDLRSGAVEQQRTWVQSFEPEERLGLREGADLLYDAILACTEGPVGHGGEREWIAMTGGYDSRVLLHALNEAGRRPSLAVTWGATDEEPNSDPPVARDLAVAAGLSHRFYRYGAGSVASHAREWVVLSELASDNPGYFAAGAELLCGRGDPPVDAVYIGDAVTNEGGLPRELDDALSTFFESAAGALHQALQSVMRADAGAEAGRVFWGDMRQIAEGCPSSRLEHIQDYLWTHVYDFRWLFSPGFYKEPMVTAWRPMLLGPAYDALARIPARLRAYRRVYVEMVKRRLPAPFRLPHADANSLVDWRYASRNDPSLREYLQRGTSWAALEATPMGEFLDREATEALTSTFFANDPQPMQRQPRSGSLVALRRRFAATPLIGDALREGRRLLRTRVGLSACHRAEVTRLLWRFAVLGSLHEAIVDGAFAGAKSVPRGQVRGCAVARGQQGVSVPDRPLRFEKGGRTA